MVERERERERERENLFLPNKVKTTHKLIFYPTLFN